MCGIVGVVNPKKAPAPEESLLRRMLAMIRHRGPDEFGIYLDSSAGLGNARLSIIDLKGGQQPISNEDGTLWIVFNGEIFNYPELRLDLEARGHRFSTSTDTEVVLHAYEEFGPDCLKKFNGQFAIAIWNKHERKLFLARDRLGVRPLFYTERNGTFVFGSEIKAILAGRQVCAELDSVAIEQVFTYWSPLGPRTVFRGIKELPPAHYLIVGEGQLTLAAYWSLAFPTQDGQVPKTSVGECVEEFRHLLTDAVRIRLRADVPVGAYLSGGLDSSTIAAIVRQLGVSRLDTFSIAFSDPQFDESSFQRRMAKLLGTEHQVVCATHADIGRVFPQLIWHSETPLMRTSPAPMFLLSQLVHSRGYKVVLTGEGADEFLAGYDIFKEASIRRFWARCPDSRWRPLLLQRLYPDIANLSGTNHSFLKAFFGAGLEAVDGPYYSHAIRWKNNQRTHRFFSEDFTNTLHRDNTATVDDRPDLPAGFSRWHPLARAQYLEIKVFLSQYLLSSQGDRPAMAHAVEGRFPFLDPQVVEFCNRLPARMKLSGLNEKALLRRAAAQWLPNDISRRRKRPYRAPIHRSFFNDASPEYVRDLLGPRAIREAGIFNVNSVDKLVAKIERGNLVGETDDMALVGILSTQLVYLQFIKNFQMAAPLSDADNVKIQNCLLNHSSKDPASM